MRINPEADLYTDTIDYLGYTPIVPPGIEQRINAMDTSTITNALYDFVAMSAMGLGLFILLIIVGTTMDIRSNRR